MFGIGAGEMVVIAVFLLIAVGPDKLPTMIKTVARTYRQFRRAANEIRASTGIDDLLRDEELKELAELRKQKLLAMSQKSALKPAAPKPAAATPAAPASPAAPSSPAVARPSERPSGADPVDDDVPMAPTPFARDGIASGLTHHQRTMEMPPEGVDVVEARHALAAAKIPETRAEVGSDVEALEPTVKP